MQLDRKDARYGAERVDFRIHRILEEKKAGNNNSPCKSMFSTKPQTCNYRQNKGTVYYRYIDKLSQYFLIVYTVRTTANLVILPNNRFDKCFFFFKLLGKKE